MSSLFSKFHWVQFCTSDPWFITLLYLYIVLSIKSFTEMPLPSLHDHLIISSWIVISVFTNERSWLETGLHSVSYCIEPSCLISFVCCRHTLKYDPFFSLYRFSWLSFVHCYNLLYLVLSSCSAYATYMEDIRKFPEEVLWTYAQFVERGI